MAQEALIALLSEQSAIVSEKHALIWRSLEFSAASAGALIGLSMLLLDRGGVSNVLIAIVLSISFLICIAGISIVHRESQLFLKAVYAVSVLHNKIAPSIPFTEGDLKNYGIDELQFRDCDSAEEYAEKWNLCWWPISLKPCRVHARILIYYVLSALALLSVAFMGYVLIIDC